VVVGLGNWGWWGLHTTHWLLDDSSHLIRAGVNEIPEEPKDFPVTILKKNNPRTWGSLKNPKGFIQ
jgi:hypothetical protein